MEYDVDYFIRKFEAIPDELWCEGVDEGDSKRKCAINHLVEAGEYEAKLSLDSLMELKIGGSSRIKFLAAVINDGEDYRYQQPTPKARILAALNDIEAKQQLTH